MLQIEVIRACFLIPSIQPQIQGAFKVAAVVLTKTTISELDDQNHHRNG